MAPGSHPPAHFRLWPLPLLVYSFAMRHLSPRQQQIVRLQGQGLAQKEIADRLHISLGTVKTHVARAQAITGAASGIEMQSGIHRREMSTVEIGRASCRERV